MRSLVPPNPLHPHHLSPRRNSGSQSDGEGKTGFPVYTGVGGQRHCNTQAQTQAEEDGGEPQACRGCAGWVETASLPVLGSGLWHSCSEGAGTERPQGSPDLASAFQREGPAE